jgi:hypothetical protein
MEGCASGENRGGCGEKVQIGGENGGENFTEK